MGFFPTAPLSQTGRADGSWTLHLFTKHISGNDKKRVSIFKGLLIGSARAQALGPFNSHFTDEELKATGEAADSQVSELAGDGVSRRQARDLRRWPQQPLNWPTSNHPCSQASSNVI